MVFSPILLEAHNPGPMTGAGNNTYLLVGDDRLATLIDAGIGHERHLAALQQELDNHGATLAEVLVTHAHSDHAAGVPALAAAHPAASFFKYPWPEVDIRYPATWQRLDDGQRVRAGGEWLTVLHTPGHSVDHLAFWHEPTRTLFGGDLVIPGSSVTIDPARGGSLERYLESLRRMQALTPARILPAHGREVRNPPATLEQHLHHRAYREKQIVAALSAGPQTVESIAESIYDGLRSTLMDAARRNVRAHLEKLGNERRAFEQGGRWTLERTP